MAESVRKPRLIPVIDVMGGEVVRAVGGDRTNYQPVTCPLSGGRRVEDIAHALAHLSGTSELYVADLDAITGNGSVSPAVAGLLRRGRKRFWADVGIRSVETLLSFPCIDIGIHPVIGSETCPGPDVLAECLAECRVSGRLPPAFSIDLRAGEVIGNWGAWWLKHRSDALGLARRVVELGVRTLIVLDLARVGTGTGCGTETLLRAIRDEFHDVELIAGGGVRTWVDIDRLGEAGADAVLVASALHDDTITFPRPS